MYIMQLVHLKNLDEKKEILSKTSILNENDKNFLEKILKIFLRSKFKQSNKKPTKKH